MMNLVSTIRKGKYTREDTDQDRQTKPGVDEEDVTPANDKFSDKEHVLRNIPK